MLEIVYSFILANATFHEFFLYFPHISNARQMTKIAHWNAVCGTEWEWEGAKERVRERRVHLWQEAALEFSQLCVKTRQAIFVARMIYVRPFVARTNLCHNRINKCATCAAIGLLQIPLCGLLRRHVQRIYSIKNTRIFKMLFQIHKITAPSVGRISWMTGILCNWCIYNMEYK